LKSSRDQRERDGQWLVAHQSVEVLSVRMEDIAKDLSERLRLGDEMASTRGEVEQLERTVKAAEASRLQQETEIAAGVPSFCRSSRGWDSEAAAGPEGLEGPVEAGEPPCQHVEKA
jgi:hypothetical protein